MGFSFVPRWYGLRIDADSRISAWYQAPAAVQSIRACELDGQSPTREIIAGCADEGVLALQVVGR